MEILRVIFCIQAGVTISLSVGLIIGGISSGKFGILNLLVKSTVLNKFGKIFSMLNAFMPGIAKVSIVNFTVK